MPAPIVAAAALAARLATRKLAKDAAKKTAKKAAAANTPANRAKAKANARGLKAAQGKSLASPVKKAAAKKNAKERAMVKRIAQANKSLNMKEPYATKDAMRLADRIKASKKTSNSLVKQLKKDAPKLAIGPAIAGATLSIPSVRKNIKNQISESKKNKAKVTKKK